MIFKLYPAHKDYLWGGTRLNKEFFKNRPGIVAETWELSVHPDGPSVITGSGTAYDGQTLAAYLAAEPQALGQPGELPILIKFIDAAKDLSIQVHPDNEYALAHEGQLGKTECWYVLDAAPGAFLYYGVNRPLSREDFRRAIEENTLLDVLRRVPVKKGDFFFIPAGTIHAIGAGILVAEIQQNSNVTYRVYDFNRKDANGQLRQLHIEQAIAVSDLTPTREDFDFAGHLCQCPYFTVDKIIVRNPLRYDPQSYQGRASFHSLLILDGVGTLTDGQVSYPLRKGDSFFVSADHSAYTVDGNFTMLLTTLGQ